MSLTTPVETAKQVIRHQKIWKCENNENIVNNENIENNQNNENNENIETNEMIN